MNNLRCFSKSLVVAFAVGFLVVVSISCGVKEEVKVESTQFAPEVEEVLQNKIDIVRQTIAEDPRIIESLQEFNETNQDITMSEIKRLDDQWIATEGIEGLVTNLLSNETSYALMEFQDRYEGYPEIFITNVNGLIVGLTNKTSDYYQADEDWWTKTYNQGQGMASHGGIEYDESALAEAIAIYLPILDPNTGTAIGVMKVVVDITAIKMAL